MEKPPCLQDVEALQGGVGRVRFVSGYRNVKTLQTKWFSTVGRGYFWGDKAEPQSDRPEFLGNDKFHSSHRASLLYKGLEDATFVEMTQYVQIYSREIGIEAKKSAWKGKFDGFWNKYGLPESNWYDQFGWVEKPVIDYWWM